jgi:trehalose-phosphatase
LIELVGELEQLARTAVLLVACDYDGTIAPIVVKPEEAKPNREAVVALHGLALLPQTHVAVISGRGLRDLSALSGLSESVHLVGSHGSEFDLDFAESLSPEQRALRDKVCAGLQVLTRRSEGLLLEVKPASVAFHCRLAEDRAAQEAIDLVLNGPGRLPGVFVKQGKKVIELSVVPFDKGNALTAIRHRLGASSCLYIGDDASDEDAFATLRGPDIGIKVGEGPTAARCRIADASEAAQILATLLALREAWLKGAEAVPIERHAS